MWWFRSEPAHLPRSTGPYMPGCKDIMLDYSPSGIFFRLYYPTEKSSKDTPEYKKWFSCIPGDEYLNGMANVVMVYSNLLKILIWRAGNPLVPALYGEKISIKGDKIKCIVMSHGLGAFRGFHNSVCVELASWGFLVLILEHRDQSSCYTYYYGSEEDAKKDIRTPIEFRQIPFGKAHYDERNKQIHYRSKECEKALEFLLKLNRGEIPKNILDEVPSSKRGDFHLSDLTGKIDVENLIILGHSFGGGTALYTLAKRKEFKYGILLDPWMFGIKGENIIEEVKQPLIFINTQTFHIRPNVKIMEKYLKNTDKMYTIKSTTHENQTDSVFIMGYWLNWFMRKIDPRKGLRINNYLLLRFLKQHVGIDSDINDCEEYLKKEQENILEGLTKPWA